MLKIFLPRYLHTLNDSPFNSPFIGAFSWCFYQNEKPVWVNLSLDGDGSLFFVSLGFFVVLPGLVFLIILTFSSVLSSAEIAAKGSKYDQYWVIRKKFFKLCHSAP